MQEHDQRLQEVLNEGGLVSARRKTAQYENTELERNVEQLRHDALRQESIVRPNLGTALHQSVSHHHESAQAEIKVVTEDRQSMRLQVRKLQADKR